MEKKHDELINLPNQQLDSELSLMPKIQSAAVSPDFRAVTWELHMGAESG